MRFILKDYMSNWMKLLTEKIILGYTQYLSGMYLRSICQKKKYNKDKITFLFHLVKLSFIVITGYELFVLIFTICFQSTWNLQYRPQGLKLTKKVACN